VTSFSDQRFHEPGLDFNIVYYGKGKGRVIPLQARCGQDGG